MGQMYEIAYEKTPDGCIRLEQQYGVDEPNLIYLSPEQLRLITAELCGRDSGAPDLATPTAFWKLMTRLRDKAEELYDLLDSVPCFPPSSEETSDVTAARELFEELEFLLCTFAPSNQQEATLKESPAPRTLIESPAHEPMSGQRTGHQTAENATVRDSVGPSGAGQEGLPLFNESVGDSNES